MTIRRSAYTGTRVDTEHRPLPALLLPFLLGLAPAALARGADGDPALDAETLDRIEVVGRRQRLVGDAISASEGVVGQLDIADRALLRTGDLLEFVPGLVATQHSGNGKANQYFLRGFNLDHGTDFATFVDCMPVNLRTHGHGQGYTDINFIIPETVERLTYRKGNYYAEVGDFSSAGSARFSLADRVDRGRAAFDLGEQGHGRLVVVDSVGSSDGRDLLFGVELQTHDGPWRDIEEDLQKRNLLLRLSSDAGGGRAQLTFMGYDNRWNSADQIPARAVEQGLISTFGSLDTTLGGESSRYSLSGGWDGPAFGGEFDASAYAIDYALDLWSNFTYFLDDPENGDQFQQVDERRIYGFHAEQRWDQDRSRWQVGVEGRHDDIGRVALLRTRNRQFVGSVRDDRVDEGSLGIYVAHEYTLGDSLRSYLGLRHDRFDFDVDSALAINSGKADDSLTSAKASLAWQPAAGVELYASLGTGLHSNDARGTTIRVDPVSGDPVDPVDPLVRSRGAEAGLRWSVSDQLQATLALWRLDLDSELLFVGDAGTTEATRPSTRRGVELGSYWFPTDRVSLNLEAAWTHARFDDRDPAGRRIPGSIPLVVSSGVTAHLTDGWLVNAQLRHFGRYPLIEDASVRSDGSTLVNLRVGQQWERWGTYLDVLNLFDSDDHDIDYYYASRLPGEPEAGIEDIHFHIFARRALRVIVKLSF